MSTIPLNKQIYAKYQLGPASHMTHIDNVEPILCKGAVSAYNAMLKEKYISIANDDVQKGRAAIQVLSTGKTLHDFVPLYFGNRTPMVAANQHLNNELVFMRFSLDVLAHGNVIITDGNARSGSTKFTTFTALSDLDVLKPACINTVKYASDPVTKHHKQAEILVPELLPLVYLLDFICYSEKAKMQLLEIMGRCGKKYSVQVLPTSWYFTTPVKGSSAI